MRNVKGIVVTLAPPAPDVTVIGGGGLTPKILVDKATLQVIVGRRRLAAMRAAGIPITEDMIERVLRESCRHAWPKGMATPRQHRRTPCPGTRRLR